MHRLIVAAVAAFALAATAQAADYPTRPVRVIVPTPPGGPVDTMARLLTASLSPILGQNVHDCDQQEGGEQMVVHRGLLAACQAWQ